MLRPLYQIPTPHALSTNLLNAEYERVEIDRNQKLLESDNLTLVTDGWPMLLEMDSLMSLYVCLALFFTKPRGSAKETGLYISKELFCQLRIMPAT